MKIQEYSYRSLVLIACLSLSAQVIAQEKQEGTKLESGAAAKVQSKKRIVKYNDDSSEVVDVSSAEASAPVTIVNSPKFQTAQNQPTTTVEAAPLKDSRADILRKSRQDMESQTESKIVEKLEESRLQDERSRADRIFGNGNKEKESNKEQAAQPAPTPAPVQVQPAPTPAPVAEKAEPKVVPVVIVQKEKVEKTIEKDVSEDRKSVHEEIREALAEAKQAEKVETNSYYIGGKVGISEYPSASNVRGTGAAGFTVGFVTDEHIVTEGGFTYSTYDLEVVSPYYVSAYPPFKGVTQYNFDLGVKYQFLSGRLRPTAGVLGAVTYRKYADKQYYYVQSNDASTTALDIGLTAGLDIQVTSSFLIGLDFKYLTNLVNRQDSNYQQSFVYPQFQQGTPLEKLDYYSATLSGKVLF